MGVCNSAEWWVMPLLFVFWYIVGALSELWRSRE